MSYDDFINAYEQTLIPRLTDEVLAVMAEAARVHGNSGDYVATCQFVEAMFDLAGKPCPDLSKPYDELAWEQGLK